MSTQRDELAWLKLVRNALVTVDKLHGLDGTYHAYRHIVGAGLELTCYDTSWCTRVSTVATQCACKMERTLEGVWRLAEEILIQANAADTVHADQENLAVWNSKVEIEWLAPQEYELRPLPEDV